jgi:S-(hydroxymethyl)glutathione dehydrogenase / alcohol dehydrogenase
VRRLELARGQGATDTWLAGSETVERIQTETNGFGADYTFEATGRVDVMRQAVEAARMGWGLCTVAGVAGKGETLDVIPRWLIQGRRIAGSSFGGVKGRDQVPELVTVTSPATSMLTPSSRIGSRSTRSTRVSS